MLRGYVKHAIEIVAPACKAKANVTYCSKPSCERSELTQRARRGQQHSVRIRNEYR
ncbi:hypothetical protein BURPSPAST_C1384 [Burkholderia pseudomallei Pasteur 52237]|nr:hypothetical protein BURPSPAST_C1384 [Burkholderia pseudomallei Pasteur 52237]